MKTHLTFAVLVTCLSFNASAMDSYRIQYVENAPKIDADESDSAWLEADTLTQFSLPWETKIAPATEFKAVWDKNAIYFRYRVVDNNVTTGVGKNAALDSDRVEIFLARDIDLTEYYTMEIDAKDQIYSAMGAYNKELKKRKYLINYEWPGLQTNSKKTEYGYLVEGAIPIETLTKMDLWQDEEKTSLLCALMRAEFTKVDDQLETSWITWRDPKLPFPHFHNPKVYGQCQLVK
ncbi:TPA: carbohydrate-binding family 9-like protein [Vibrio parahaemolyticus]